MRPPKGTDRGRRRTLARITYQHYIDSQAWRQVRLAWADEYDRRHPGRPARCVICGQEWKVGRDDLHHLTYDRLGAERFDDLMPLCRADHELLHRWLDSSKSWRRLQLRVASIELARRLADAQSARAVYGGCAHSYVEEPTAALDIP